MFGAEEGGNQGRREPALRRTRPELCLPEDVKGELLLAFELLVEKWQEREGIERKGSFTTRERGSFPQRGEVSARSREEYG